MEVTGEREDMPLCHACEVATLRGLLEAKAAESAALREAAGALLEELDSGYSVRVLPSSLRTYRALRALLGRTP